MPQYFNVQVNSTLPVIWESSPKTVSPDTPAIQQYLGDAFSRFTHLQPDVVHWCPGLWLLLGDTGVGKSTIVNSLWNSCHQTNPNFVGSQVYRIGEPGFEIFPYSEQDWEAWCTALLFADHPTITQVTSEKDWKNSIPACVRQLQAANYGAQWILIQDLLLQLSFQFGELWRQEERPDDHPQQGATLPETLSDEQLHDQHALLGCIIMRLWRDYYRLVHNFHPAPKESWIWPTALSTLTTSIEETIRYVNVYVQEFLEEEFIIDDLFFDEYEKTDSKVLFIDSLTQLPYRSTSLSYTSGGLSIEVFKGLSQIDYLARIADKVIVATFNPTVFSKQLLNEFMSAMPGVATGFLYFKRPTQGESNSRDLFISSRIYNQTDDGIVEERFEENVTYSLDATIPDSNRPSDWETSEEDFAPADFY